MLQLLGALQGSPATGSCVGIDVCARESCNASEQCLHVAHKGCAAIGTKSDKSFALVAAQPLVHIHPFSPSCLTLLQAMCRCAPVPAKPWAQHCVHNATVLCGLDRAVMSQKGSPRSSCSGLNEPSSQCPEFSTCGTNRLAELVHSASTSPELYIK